MSDQVTVALAQLDLVVGDVSGNTARIIEYSERARDRLGADVVVFPELSLCGYPPEDLLSHSGLCRRVEEALEIIRSRLSGIAVILGFPEYVGDDIFNSCTVFLDGKELARYRKHLLPNYSVFDEKRYFKAGKEAAVFTLNGIRIGLIICEDMWRSSPTAAARSAGAEVLMVINGSPYDMLSQETREEVVKARIAETGIPAVYLNMVGGQDELVFDGGSFAMDATGDICFRAEPFEEGLHTIQLVANASGVSIEKSDIEATLGVEESVYKALVCGTRDYVEKNGFPGVILGLSGGVDSALTLSIACDALGADRVRAIMMPFRYTSTMSQEDAAAQASLLGVHYDVLPIASIYDATTEQLREVVAGLPDDATE